MYYGFISFKAKSRKVIYILSKHPVINPLSTRPPFKKRIKKRAFFLYVFRTPIKKKSNKITHFLACFTDN